MNLNQVILPVTNMALAVDFYQTLGFELIVDTPHYTRFACPGEGATFSLTLADEQDQQVENPTVVYFEHEALDEWVEELQNKKVQFEQLPTDKPYLWREASLKDPSGNRLKLYWAGENRLNPPWRVK